MDERGLHRRRGFAVNVSARDLYQQGIGQFRIGEGLVGGRVRNVTQAIEAGDPLRIIRGALPDDHADHVKRPIPNANRLSERIALAEELPRNPGANDDDAAARGEVVAGERPSAIQRRAREVEERLGHRLKGDGGFLRPESRVVAADRPAYRSAAQRGTAMCERSGVHGRQTHWR